MAEENMRTIQMLAAAAAGLTLVTACSTAPVVTDVPAALEVAKTGDDHRRLADYFESKAKAYEAEAAEHGRLAGMYRGGLGSAGRYERGASMAAHCRQLQTQFSNAAGEARALARAHRDLAAAVK
jgi:hypothetical protein